MSPSKWGLITLGAGIAVILLSMVFGGWGPCGPGGPFGIVLYLVGLPAIPIGIILCLAAGIRARTGRPSATPMSAQNPNRQ